MASINDEKLRIMEDEMNRFEEEIGLPNAPLATDTCQVIGTRTYDQVQRQLDMDAPLAPPPLIPPPPPPPMFIPQQVRMVPPGPPIPGMGPPIPDQRPGHPGMNFVPGPGPGQMGPFSGPMGPGPMGFRHPGPPMGGPMGPPGMMPPGMYPPGMGPRHPGHMPGFPGQPMGPMTSAPPMMAPPMMTQSEYESPPVIQKKPTPAKVVVSATPKLYISKPSKTENNGGSAPVIGVSEMPRSEPSSDDTMKKATKKPTPQKPGGIVAKEMAEKVKASAVVSISTDANAPNAANNSQPNKKKDKKNKKFIRTAGGNSWEDASLCDWEEDDFRLFCGDLGNDVTDEVLTRAFSKYPSFLKAKVVRDKRTNKTKGFGFVSFKDPQDFIRATKEMNGRYVGSRPIKLRKSTWKQRSLEVVRKKDKEKQALIGLLTGR